MKNLKPGSAPNKNNPKKGFALVSTILVMSMLLLLSISMLSMSSVTSRSTNIDRNQQEAKANARMAMMMALGDLQRCLGPDQRVTANAAIYDTSPDTLAMDGVANPQWLGAYKTTFGDDDDPMIYSENASGGYLKDHRGDGKYKHRDNILKYLVSGVTEGDSTIALSDAANKHLIIQGQNVQDNVYVPKVNTENGTYAYHVKDMGMSAPIYQYNPIAGKPIDDTEAGQSLLYTGSHRPFDIMSQTAEKLDHLSSEEMIKDEKMQFKHFTLSQTELNADVDAVREVLSKYIHDLDIPAEALMIDTVRSGLKIDLTKYIKENSATLVGEDGNTILTDTTPMIDSARSKFSKFSPKFGVLRDYAKLGTEINNGKIKPRAPVMGSGASGAYPSYDSFTKVPVHPYITEFSIYLSVVYDVSAPSKLSLLIYPRVTLYNPNNVTLEASRYFVQFNRRLYFVLNVPDQNGNGERNKYWQTSPYWGSINGDPAGARPKYLGFYLDPVEIGPGEALVFTPKQKLTRLNYLDGNTASNVLSAKVSPDSRHAFSDPLNGPAYDKAKGDGTYRVLRYWQNGHHVGYSDSLSARLRLNTKNQLAASYAGNISQSKDFPIVHTLDAQNWKRGNEGRWRDINKTLPIGEISNSGSVNPVNRTMLGLRMKNPEEAPSNLINAPNGFWREAIINNFNLRAGVHRRSPWDYIHAISTVGHEAAFGPYTSDNQEQPDYTSAFMKPAYSDGKYKFSPLLGSAGNGMSMPLFELPSKNEEFFSIGQFRSTPLTQVFDHPSNIIGESIAPRTVPRGQTAYGTSEYKAAWEQGLHMGRVRANAKWFDSVIDPSNNISSYDARYETNHALWDSYFFSTYDPSGPANEKVKNKKLIITDEVLENAADRIAKYVKLKGHLNVNSTSVLAWKSILMMNAGAKVGSHTTDAKSTPFPSMIKPTKGAAAGDTSSTSNSTWNGYRTLSEPEAQTLAEAIVAQVKRRAPFIGVSDFVNRRLIEGETPNKDPRTQDEQQKMSYAGTIDLALMESKINNNLKDYEAVYNKSTLIAPGFGAPRIDQGNQPTELFHGASTHLSQSKILQTIGSSLTARSDTYKILAYGESKDNAGNVLASATCEIIVQRTIDFVDTTDAPETKYEDLNEVNKKFGRKFQVISFKWL